MATRAIPTASFPYSGAETTPSAHLPFAATAITTVISSAANASAAAARS